MNSRGLLSGVEDGFSFAHIPPAANASFLRSGRTAANEFAFRFREVEGLRFHQERGEDTVRRCPVSHQPAIASNKIHLSLRSVRGSRTFERAARDMTYF